MKGVYIMRKNYAGLFGYLDGGTIQNVGVVESNISGSRIGGIVAIIGVISILVITQEKLWGLLVAVS